MIEHKNLLGYFNFLLSLVENHEGKMKKNEVGISKRKMPTQSLFMRHSHLGKIKLCFIMQPPNTFKNI
jgi:hypothetical protein